MKYGNEVGMEVGVDRSSVLLSHTMKLFVLYVTKRVRVILGNYLMQLANEDLRQLKLKQFKVRKNWMYNVGEASLYFPLTHMVDHEHGDVNPCSSKTPLPGGTCIVLLRNSTQGCPSHVCVHIHVWTDTGT